MRKIFIENQNNRVIGFIMLLLVVALIASFVFGCGNDTINNTVNNNSSQIVYSLDSFSVHTYTVGFYDTAFSSRQRIDLDSFKVSFWIYTNNDSNDFDKTSFNIVDTGNVILSKNISYCPNGSFFSFSGYSENGLCEKTVNIDLSLRNIFLPANHKYLSVRNFKIENLVSQ